MVDCLLNPCVKRSGLCSIHTLGGLDVGFGGVVRHGDADDHIQGKQLVVEGALGLHIHLHHLISVLFALQNQPER